MTWLDLHDLYSKPCRRFARSLARDRAEAEDVVQEIMLRARDNLPLLEILSPDARRSWLFTAIRNLIIDRRRAEERHEALEQCVPMQHEPPLQLVAEVERRLNELPDHYRDIVYRRYWLGMNSTEIGADLQMPPSTVRHHLQSAHAILRQQLARQW